jgi:hypothetical protein
MFKKVMKGQKNILQSLCTHSVFCSETTLQFTRGNSIANISGII